ncbi:BgTH12-00055 [Blumeria graminis f. sp. triticale]|uniref:DNA mismatch repair protein MSH3 n=1 Tax=Blumeria graminis f. sp. triticale TaxID=1689686 RepID=A0A9W4GH06_BLUGR|nr:BgTH12-00055 [Blumeria graminis f. sp. triticale]
MISSRMHDSRTSNSHLSGSRLSTPNNSTSQYFNDQGSVSPCYSTSVSNFNNTESHNIICAVSEARGISPTVGMAFVNTTTGEAVLSQICDNQFYVRTLNKLEIFQPSEILIVSTRGPPNPKSKMYMVIEENIRRTKITTLERKYWSETLGLENIQQLAFKEDVEAIKTAIGTNYFATCCFAAAIKYIELGLSLKFSPHTLRVRYQTSEGSMMIDPSTVKSLELIQNMRTSQSKDCLFGLMNETLTPMGSRLLKSNILQPSTQVDVINQRYQALKELITNEDVLMGIGQVLKLIYDIEKLLSSASQKINVKKLANNLSINQILMLKSFVNVIPKVSDALGEFKSSLLSTIRVNCCAENVVHIRQLIEEVINEDVSYQKTPLDLRNQRTYAVKYGVSGLLDVARQTFKEATEDVHQYIKDLNQNHKMNAETRFDKCRRYYLRVSETDFEGKILPEVLVNCFRKKGYIECQTLDLMKFNQRIEDSHQEVILMSDKTIQQLIDNIRGEIPLLFRISESIAMLDMLVAFGQVAITNDYIQPEITDCIAIKSARHPIREKVHPEKFVPNDIYASSDKRFQIITGCNMSGKSTYIRSIALMSIMAQMGSFVSASYASFPIIKQLFARISVDDSFEANISTFASEMRETAFILRQAFTDSSFIRNIDKDSLVIFDELGRGTSSRDGLAIAISISETLIQSGAFIWFATHFRELAQVLSERPGVVNLHLVVDLSEENAMKMLYKIGEGYVKEEHYGIALARVANLPPIVLEVAEQVSKALDLQVSAKKKSSVAFAVARRRKLVLGLRETLKQAENSPMRGKILVDWLKRLQEEFVYRMDKIKGDIAVSSSNNSSEISALAENKLTVGETENCQ